MVGGSGPELAGRITTVGGLYILYSQLYLTIGTAVPLVQLYYLLSVENYQMPNARTVPGGRTHGFKI